MDLSFSPQEVLFRHDIQAWLLANPPSGVPDLFSHDLERRVAAGRRWQRRMSQDRWVGVGWPVEYGGRSASVTEEIIYYQELAKAGAPELLNVVGIGMIGPLVIRFGTQEQRRRWLPEILGGDEIWCLGMSEPNAGSDLPSLTTRAIMDGDEFVITGGKIWTSYALYSSWCFLVARTDPDLPRHKGLSCIAVPMDAKGIEIRPLVQIHGDREFCQVYFDEVRVPRANLLGSLNEGWRLVLETLHHERSTYALSHQVILRQYITGMLRQAEEAEAQGRSGLKDPVLRQKIAQAVIEVEILGYYSLKRIGDIQKKGLGPESSVDKLYWTEMNQRIQETAMEILGPFSLLAGHDAPDQGRWLHDFLHSKADTIYSGTSEIQRNTIADALLEMPR